MTKCDVITVDNAMLLGALKRLKDKGDITLEQYASSLRRAKEVKDASFRN